MSYEAQVAQARAMFVSDTSEHEMTILLDTGEYRHIRFQKPGTSMYFFDLVTWPGHLTITGDCGTFQFSRTRDMFEFFVSEGKDGFSDERWGINPQYWAEKLQAPKPAGAERYSYDSFREHVQEWLESVSEDLEPGDARSLAAAVNEKLLASWSDAVHSEHEAHRALYEFEHNGIRISDSWEWSLREFDAQYLWCCWAIVWGIGEYRKHAAVPSLA